MTSYSKILSAKNHLLVLMLIYSSSTMAQETQATAGGDISGSGGSVSFTIGQPFFTVLSGADHSIYEGVQQPLEISVLSLNDHDIASLFNIYPIPTSDFVTLKISNFLSYDLSYDLIDLQGKIILSNSITSSETQIHLENLDATIYFLNIKNKGALIRTTKILKF